MFHIVFIFGYIFSLCQGTFQNNRPIIGILAQKYYGPYLNYSSQNVSYIASSYVKFVESGGARAIPIHVNMSGKYYKKVFNSINGILFPGGDQNLSTSGYSKAGKILWNLALKANLAGDYFPIFGTCLGFEFLTILASGDNFLQKCSYYNIQAPIKFDYSFEKIKKTKMFASINFNLYKIMKNENVTVHFHHFCISNETFFKTSLNYFFRVISQNDDINGLKFISIIESEKYPFYGVAFHPEKNLFDFILSKHHNQIPHTFHSIQASQYFANFFINEARKNSHKFNNLTEEIYSLIYNYPTTFLGTYVKENSFDEVYFFDNNKIYDMRF